MGAGSAIPPLSSVSVGALGVHIKPGCHICAFYPTLAERDDILMPYLREGLAQGDKCLGVLDTGSVDDLRDALMGARQSAEDMSGEAQLELFYSRDTYLAGGAFDVDAMLNFWNRSVGSALDQGFPSARAVGEMTWALSNVPGSDELVSYEARLNQFLPRYPQVVLCCLYELERFDGEVLVDVLKTHPKVLLGGIVMDNPYYLEPEEYLASRQAKVAVTATSDEQALADRHLREQLSNLQLAHVVPADDGELAIRTWSLHLAGNFDSVIRMLRDAGIKKQK